MLLPSRSSCWASVAISIFQFTRRIDVPAVTSGMQNGSPGSILSSGLSLCVACPSFLGSFANPNHLMRLGSATKSTTPWAFSSMSHRLQYTSVKGSLLLVSRRLLIKKARLGLHRPGLGDLRHSL